MELSDVIDLNERRSSVYRMLSSIYWKELTEAQIKALGNALADDAPGEGRGEVESALKLMAGYLAKAHSGTRQDLAVDYAHTFLAAGNNEDRMAIPFESVFTSETGLLMQEPRDEVCKAFLAEHREPLERLHTPEDHVSFELEFMAQLAELQNEAVSAGDLAEAARLGQVQGNFLETHLGNWIPDFCAAVADCCRTDFYRAVAELTRAWIAEEAAALAELQGALAAAPLGD